jgi:hypothetical protein
MIIMLNGPGVTVSYNHDVRLSNLIIKEWGDGGCAGYSTSTSLEKEGTTYQGLLVFCSELEETEK